jgi:peptide/nickel transport system substrate-binding protein
MIFRSAAFAFLLLTAPAFAETKGDCGTLILPKVDDITRFNPEFASSLYDQQAANLLFEQLVWVNRYYKIDWARSIASAITTPDAGTTYNVTLRSWHWSDGVPVTTADIAYTLQLIRAIGTYYPGYGNGGMPDIIKSFNIIDATHFQVILTHQVNPLWFIYNGLVQLQPMPAHIWSHYTPDQIYQLQSTPAFFAVDDGPLKVTELDPGLQVIFVRNPAYEGPKMHFKKLIFRFVHSDGGQLLGLQSGELDLAWLPPSLWAERNDIPGTYIANQNSISIDSIALNFRNPDIAFLRDVRVRQAIQDAVDQPTMSNLLFHGNGWTDYGPIPPSPPGFLSPAMQAGRYPVGYNLPKARALLTAAGFSPGPDGIMQKNGNRLSFTVIITSASDEQMMDIIQDDERKAGIEIKIRNMEFSEMITLMNSPSTSSWQAAILGNMLNAFPSGEGAYSSTASFNAGGYADKTMDQLIDDSITKPGLDGLFNYEDYAAAQQPVIFLPDVGNIFLVKNNLRGMDDFENTLAQYSPDALYCTGPLQ